MTTPATEAEQRGLQVLGQAMDELRQAQEARDESTVWRRTLEVLNLMHSLDDQAHKRLGKDYREVTRRATEDGRAQAALTLVRGIVHHHGSEVQAPVWRRLGIFTARPNGERVEMRMYTARDGEYVPMEASTALAAWSPLSALPPSPEKHLHDRDTYYAQHVEGLGLMEPLVAAQRFLAGLQQE